MGAPFCGRDSTLHRREERHRRAAVFGMGVLILLGVSPILGHHLGGRIDQLLAGRDHLGFVCLIALHELLEPIHDLFHIFLVAGVLYALGDRLRARRRMRGVLSVLSWEAPAQDGTILRVARRAGVDPRRIRVVAGLPSPAFTSGWVRPRIYVARELEQRLSEEELATVLIHEGAHVTRHDPLRLSVLRFIGCVLFWMPVLRRLAEDCADEAEICADDVAATNRPLVLASALLALAQWRPSAPLSGVGFKDRDLLTRRVRRLAGEEVLPVSHVTRRSLLGAAFMLVVVWSTGTVMAHPMTNAGAHLAHCRHPTEWAWQHLFCLRSKPIAPGEACPHRFE